MKQDYKVPEWMTECYFLKVLQSDCTLSGHQIRLIRYKVEFATNKGDNYASEMFRIFLEFTRNGEAEEKRIILKKDYDNAEVKKFFDPYNLYSTEITYYRLYLPAFEKILRSGGLETQLSPRMIYHETPVFIMEDMAPLNYRTVSRETRFDRATVKLVLVKLARLHAASMVYNKNNGGALEKKSTALFEVEDGFMKVLLKKFKCLINAVKSWGPEYGSIVPKLEFVLKNYFAIGSKAIKPNDGLGVLIHGDTWLNNILIRFDQKNAPTDVLLIDLQISYWSSPAIDLLYLIFTSLNEEDYQDQLCLDGLIQHYHTELSGTLRSLNYSPVPNLMQLHLEIQSKLIHGKNFPEHV